MAESKTASTTKKPAAVKASAPAAASAKPAAKKAPAKPAAAKTVAKPASKAASSRVTATKPKAPKLKVTPEQRHFMVAEAAYYRAERRGFEGGYEWQDWMDAEMEIDRMIQAKK